MPLFLLMVFGYLFRRAGVISESFASGVNSFVFRITLPAMLFKDLASEKFSELWDFKFFLLCFFVTVASIAFSYFISPLFATREEKAEFVQSSFRSSAAILGVGLAEEIYGRAGMTPLMIIGAVPLYNVCSVLLLSFPATGTKGNADGKSALKKAVIGILTNPIIDGIVVGMAWSLLEIPQPVIMKKTFSYFAQLTTPLGMISLGANLQRNKGEKANVKAIVVATFLKLVGFALIFIPIAVKLGYRDDALVAILIMLASPVTVASFIMSKNMGHKGDLSAECVFFSTVLCAFTLTLWLYVLKSLALI